MTLHGGARNLEHDVEISYDEIVGVGRTRERIGRLAAFRIEGLAGSVLIAAYGTGGLNTEIVEELQAALAADALSARAWRSQ